MTLTLEEIINDRSDAIWATVLIRPALVSVRAPVATIETAPAVPAVVQWTPVVLSAPHSNPQQKAGEIDSASTGKSASIIMPRQY